MEGAVSRCSIVVAAKEQISCDLAGEAAILNLKSGVYYGLDPVGAAVVFRWRIASSRKQAPGE